jgi:subtilase family serine protease
VSDTAINRGGGAAGTSLTQYYFGTFTSKTSNSRLLIGNRAVIALSAGGNSSGTVTVTVPADMPLGTYYLLACSDDSNLVTETNENNNCAAAARRVQVSP